MTTIKVNNIKSGNPGISGWNAILDPYAAPPRVLDEHITADWLVVGGGFTGLAAARKLSQNRPEDRIVLLDALRIGEGSAGRSSGFMIDLPHTINADSYIGGVEADKRQTEMNRTALRFAADAADEYGFDQSIFDPCGKMYAAVDEAGLKHNRDYAAHLERMGESARLVSAAEMKEISGLDYYIGGLHTPGTIMLQPAGYVRALAEGLTETNAVDIYENSPVIEMKQEGSVWQVKTPQGTVTTPKIILAVNGHLESFGYYKRQLMHLFLYASMTRPLTTAEATRLGGNATWNMVPADPMGSTMRRLESKDGPRILTRNKFRYSMTVEDSASSPQRFGPHQDRSFTARFPMLQEVEQEYRWGGRLCLTWNSEQVLGEIEQGVYAAVAQNGLGASLGTLSGMLAADYAAGVENPYVQSYLNKPTPPKLPPEPLSWIGANIYLNWKEWQAGKEK